MIEFLVEVQEPGSEKIYAQRVWQTWFNIDPIPNCKQIAKYRSALETVKKLPHPCSMSWSFYMDNFMESIWQYEDWLEAVARKLGCQAC